MAAISIKGARVDHLDHPSLLQLMDRAQGNLTTGIYVAICNLNKDDNVAKVEAQGNGYQILGTKDRNDENIEWHIESLGNDRYRCHNKKSGTAFEPSTYAEGALLDQEIERVFLIFRETENKGEFFMSFDEYPSWYICPLGHGSGYKISTDPNQARWSFFKVDN
ncbi:hypothetical protein F5887DRAFT_180939 [Amanita rubescens]|nr:hypothetical protein F5887DRAFT_180939 [Amanita rubescens]